jgi:hypothetical protein
MQLPDLTEELLAQYQSDQVNSLIATLAAMQTNPNWVTKLEDIFDGDADRGASFVVWLSAKGLT